MYEDILFKKKVFENSYNAFLSVTHNVNTYSMKKKVFHHMKIREVIKKTELNLMLMAIIK